MPDFNGSGSVPVPSGKLPAGPTGDDREWLEKPSGGDFVARNLVTPIKRLPVPSVTSTPWGAIGLLNLAMHGQFVLLGTGFMCQPDVFLTARHNLVSKAYDAAGVWMAYDAKQHPTNPIAILGRAWHSSLDLAVLILATPQARTIEVGAQPVGKVTLAGYGFPYPDGRPGMTAAEGPINGSNGAFVGYGINTQEGDSGAPVLAGPPGAMRAVAVHTSSQGALPASNFGTLLRPQAISDLAQLIAFARNKAKGA